MLKEKQDLSQTTIEQCVVGTLFFMWLIHHILRWLRANNGNEEQGKGIFQT